MTVNGTKHVTDNVQLHFCKVILAKVFWFWSTDVYLMIMIIIADCTFSYIQTFYTEGNA